MHSAERQLRNQLRATLTEIDDLVAGLPIDFEDPQKRWSCLLYFRQVELGRDFFRAYSSNAISGGQIILRSLLEASIDLFNLCEDEGYAENLHANDLKEWLRLLREAGTEENTYLQAFSQVEGFEEQRDLWEQELEQLRASGRGPLNAYERFTRAGMTDVYRSIYNWLCGYSHNSLRAIMDRHMTVAPERIEIFFSRSGPSRDLQWAMYLDSVVGLIGQGTDRVFQMLKFRASRAQSLREAIEEVRAAAGKLLIQSASR